MVLLERLVLEEAALKLEARVSECRLYLVLSSFHLRKTFQFPEGAPLQF